MELEKFRTEEGLFLRAKDKGSKMLFKHCAGSDVVPNKQAGELTKMLFLHGVKGVETCVHPSVNKR